MTFHLFDRVAMGFVFEGFAQVRDALQAGEHESGEGFEAGVAGQEQAVLGFEVANAYCAFEYQDGFIFERRFLRRDDEFVFDVAYQLLQNIFDRDYACCRSELVYHHCQVAAAFFEFGQQFRQHLGLGNDQHIVHDVADLGAGDTRGQGLSEIDQPQPYPADQLFVIEDADDVLGAALRVVDGDARVLAFDHAVEGLVKREVGGEGKNIGAGDHDFADGDAVEFDGVVDHFFLRLGDLAELAAGGNDELEFVGGVDSAAAAGVAGTEEAQDQAAGTAHEEKYGAGQGEESFHRSGHGQGNLLGTLQGQSLWNQLSQQDMQVGDQAESDRDGDAVGIHRGVGDLLH